MSVNQSVKPITTEEKEHLYIGGCDTVELAKKIWNSVVCNRRSYFARNLSRLQKSF